MDTLKHAFQLHGVNAADEPTLRRKGAMLSADSKDGRCEASTPQEFKDQLRLGSAEDPSRW